MSLALESDVSETDESGDGETVTRPLAAIFDIEPLRAVAFGGDLAGVIVRPSEWAARGRDDPS